MNHELLRTALRELGDVPPPADLAGPALRRARRDRRRWQTAAVVAVAVAVAAAILVPVALRGPTRPPPASPAPAVWVPAYRTAGGPDAVYDATTRGYRPTPGLGVQPSPDGSRALVRDLDTNRYALVPLARLASGLRPSDWASGLPPLSWRWSADSTRLLAADDVLRPTQAVTVDARTGRLTRVPLGQSGAGNRALAWGPGGRGFAVWNQRASGAAAPPARVELTLLDESGRVSRRYPLSGVDRVSFSPNGQQALLTGDTLDGHDVHERNSLLDLRTGKVTAVPTGGDQWYDGERLLQIEPRASAATVVTVAVAATGQIERRSTLPAGQEIVDVSLARGGPAPPGAIVI